MPDAPPAKVVLERTEDPRATTRETLTDAFYRHAGLERAAAARATIARARKIGRRLDAKAAVDGQAIAARSGFLASNIPDGWYDRLICAYTQAR